MNTEEVVSLFRKDMADETTPPLWSDDEVFGYLDEAQRTLVREMGGIKDSTSSLSRCTIAVNQKTIKFTDTVLKLVRAIKVSDGTELDIINVNDMQRLGLKFDNVPGTLRYIVTGMDDEQAFLLPIPAEADTLQLVIERLPKDVIEPDKAPQELEVSLKHHRPLLDGMKALAYEKQDAETFDKRKAEEFAGKFARYCAKAKAERARKEHKPRTVAYGGMSMATRTATDYGRSR